MLFMTLDSIGVSVSFMTSVTSIAKADMMYIHPPSLALRLPEST